MSIYPINPHHRALQKSPQYSKERYKRAEYFQKSPTKEPYIFKRALQKSPIGFLLLSVGELITPWLRRSLNMQESPTREPYISKRDLQKSPIGPTKEPYRPYKRAL